MPLAWQLWPRQSQIASWKRGRQNRGSEGLCLVALVTKSRAIFVCFLQDIDGLWWLRTVRKLILLSGLIEVDFDEIHAQLDPWILVQGIENEPRDVLIPRDSNTRMNSSYFRWCLRSTKMGHRHNNYPHVLTLCRNLWSVVLLVWGTKTVPSGP
jgi:hypothetical protein